MEIAEICLLLRKSGRPLFHIGQGMRHAEKEFFEFIESIQIPFVTARNANDIADWSHPLLVGRPGTFAQRGANFAVQSCDLYIAVGTRLSLTQTGYNSKDYARNAKIIQVDIDQAELDKGTLKNPIKICMDSKEFITQLNAEWHKPTTNDRVQWSAWTRWSQYSEWLKKCQEWKAKYPVCLAEYKEEKDFVNSYYFIETLSELATPEDTIVTDMGFSFQNTHQAWKTKKGQRILTNCGLAPMGWGLPAAIGAAFATGRRVVCLTGEGGLMMNIQELATVMHHKLPIKIFVLNNGGYLTIKQTQQLGFEGRLMGVNEDTGLSFPNFDIIAQAHKIMYHKLSDSTIVRPMIELALKNDAPFISEVMMSPDQPQAPRSLNRRNPDGTMNPTKLEDSYPFLPPEVIEEEMKCVLSL